MDKKTQDCYLPVDVKDRLPEVNGYYITWNAKLLEKGLIHYHKDTGWQNGFYNDSVTHWLERHENMIVLTESEYLADKKKMAEGWILPVLEWCKKANTLLDDIDSALPNDDDWVKSIRELTEQFKTFSTLKQ